MYIIIMKKTLIFLLSIMIFSCSSSDDGGIVGYDENADPDRDGIISLYEDLNGDGDPENDDSDGDGYADYRDPDDDNDGILTILEDINQNGDPRDDDWDYDGIANYLDTENSFEWMNGTWKLANFDGFYDKTYTEHDDIRKELKHVADGELLYQEFINGELDQEQTLYYEVDYTIEYPLYQKTIRRYNSDGVLIFEDADPFYGMYPSTQDELIPENYFIYFELPNPMRFYIQSFGFFVFEECDYDTLVFKTSFESSDGTQTRATRFEFIRED